MKIIVSLLFFMAIFLFIKYIQEKREVKTISDRIIEKGKISLNEIFKDLLRIISVPNKKLPIDSYRGKLQKKINFAKISNSIKGSSLTGFTPDEFMALKELLAIMILFVYFLLFDKVDFIGLVISVLGFFLPDLWLKEKRGVYEKDISKNLPYALDLITVCVEAGLTFEGAISKFVEKSKVSFLKSEFAEMLMDVKLGKSRKESLKDMSHRVGLSDFSSFVSSVIQSEQLGTSLANTLRIQASQIRVKRTQRIEKLAMQAPTKLLIPLVIFIFPVIFIMIFGPIVIKLLGLF
ncbi:MAG: type II secretion system F family protein [Candidatus Firestonebacteria bacterium]